MDIIPNASTPLIYAYIHSDIYLLTYLFIYLLTNSGHTTVLLNNVVVFHGTYRPIVTCALSHSDIVYYTIEGLRERTEYIDIFLFSAHQSIMFCF